MGILYDGSFTKRNPRRRPLGRRRSRASKRRWQTPEEARRSAEIELRACELALIGPPQWRDDADDGFTEGEREGWRIHFKTDESIWFTREYRERYGSANETPTLGDDEEVGWLAREIWTECAASLIAKRWPFTQLV